MRRGCVGVLLALLLLATPTAAAASNGPGAALLRELNRVRARAHLAALRLDRRMNDAAATYSRHMARSRRVGHGAWDTRIAHSASDPATSGEVIGWLASGSARSEASTIVQMWLGSPVHRHVLLDGAFSRIGVGRAIGGLGGTSSAIYTVDFASAR